MDHLIDDNDRLKPCPFCGGEATFDHDDNGWNWIECLACGASTNARVSAMDDCKPLLLEQWNKRVPPACGCREGECESKPAGFSGAQPAPSVPDAWKLVPIEPTEAMVTAFAELFNVRDQKNTFGPAFRAALAAAPEAKP